jgi:valyl-tRNA synthetase
MPFLTEELWYAVYDGNPPAKSIALTNYPRAGTVPQLAPALEYMAGLQFVISGIRARRKELGIPENAKTPVKVVMWAGAFGGSGTAEKNADILTKLSQASSIEFVPFEDRDEGGQFSSLAWSAVGPTDVAVIYERTIDVPAERERLTKDIARYEKGLAAAERQLGNEGFLAKAPAQVVEGLKKQEAETRLLLEKAQAAFSALPRS